VVPAIAAHVVQLLRVSALERVVAVAEGDVDRARRGSLAFTLTSGHDDDLKGINGPAEYSERVRRVDE
jgi:hypothetical protein